MVDILGYGSQKNQITREEVTTFSNILFKIASPSQDTIPVLAKKREQSLEGIISFINTFFKQNADILDKKELLFLMDILDKLNQSKQASKLKDYKPKDLEIASERLGKKMQSSVPKD